MKRRLFTLASALSLVLFIATAALWVRSYIVSEHLTWGGSSKGGSLATGRGELLLRRTRVHPSVQERLAPGYGAKRPATDLLGPAPVGTRKDVGRFGFRLIMGADRGVRFDQLLVPIWTTTAAAMVLCVWATIAMRRRRRIEFRRRAIRCVRCGYDLRAGPDRCPECGQVQADAIASPHSERWLPVAAIALGGVMLVAWWWADPGVPAQPRTGSPPEDLALWPDWRAAAGSDPHRMEARDEWGYLRYQSVWTTGGDERLVVLNPLRGRSWGRPYDVLVFDRAMHLVRKGRITAPLAAVPYRLAEFWSEDAILLPRPYRGTWSLGVELWPSYQRYNPAAPPRQLGGLPQGGQYLSNFVYTTAVQWLDVPEPDVFNEDSHVLPDDARIRSAESDGSISPTADRQVLP